MFFVQSSVRGVILQNTFRTNPPINLEFCVSVYQQQKKICFDTTTLLAGSLDWHYETVEDATKDYERLNKLMKICTLADTPSEEKPKGKV